VQVDHEYKTDIDLEEQLKRLLVDIAKEPISDEVRALAAQLQEKLDARRAGSKPGN
jgi:hypothetical protein